MWRICILAVFLAATSGKAWAAPAAEKPARTEAEKRKDLVGLNAFSKCIASRQPDMADEILRMELESREQLAAIWAMMETLGAKLQPYSGCVMRVSGSRMRVGQPAALVGGMAESRTFSIHPNPDPVFLSAQGAKVPPRTPAERFGLCLARRKPDAAIALLRTSPMSVAEASAIATLRADFGPCLFGGQSFPGDDFALRTYLSVGVFLAADAHRQNGSMQ